MSDVLIPHDATLHALLRRAHEIATLTSSSGHATLIDDKEAAMVHYRTIIGLCARTLERLRGGETPASPALIEATNTLWQIAHLCTEVHDRIAHEDAAKAERSRRWSEVHAEFTAAQREGRPMRSEWSWERQERWEGPIT